MNWNTCWGEWIVEELVRHGTRCFCISPGSRSTPLTSAVANNPKAKAVIFFDERAAGYYALGHARATGIPAVLICTSGTAAANYLPAVVEASVEQIPLLLMTADRPPELQETGANQAVNQTHLFGTHVRWFFDPGCPGPEFTAETLLASIDHAISKTHLPMSGPVHLNFPFREPFFENTDNGNILEYKLIAGKKPFVRYSAPRKTLPEEVIQDLLGNRPESGILSIGRVPKDSHDSLRMLAAKLDWPVFADITSGLRLGENCPNRITYYDQLLHDELTTSSWEIEAIWHIGFPPTSKRWLSRWEQKPALQMVWIADHAERHDQSQQFRWKIETEIEEFCNLAVNGLKLEENNSRKSNKEKWLYASDAAEKLIDEHLYSNVEKNAINEFGLVRRLTEIIPGSFAFFIGNSLPVRAVNMFGSGKGAEVATALNRGASGIDGLIASACGFASGLNRPVVLLIGDLSAIHDLNSFKLLTETVVPVLLVIINNQGGGIFSFLPISQQKKMFETYYGTPHNLNFSSISAMFDLEYHKPESIKAFEEVFLKASQNNKSAVIEVITKRDQNPKQLEALKQKLMKCAFVPE
ncbi:MAG: 2-succinyl-5-enolpyruvyl-6-hydroxy-3-cyclohexene-1-carboxylate synthase [Deltaproteobacteria bacterium]|nr:2-succinyl-5-enolpyruvyl-6-hydroxy-3-cyclohexene-1-carboxylate synthase [Deltaproteobacteria bacterium]